MVATHQDQLGARPGNRNIQPARLEQEIRHPGSKWGAGSGKRHDDHLALLSLHPFHRIHHQFLDRLFILDDAAQETADQAALGAIGHNHANIFGRNIPYE